ncbi:hypothetical protein [Couchioplanes caeruleus]|uniref:Uncharacterized protein n=2 Tax=Couchioplanes caeruleus TaxID=56438 RepID=A0A1K0G068_9ACTN|nr:hypothetical protein [Couchioplanes caeruleus]OJF10706.1 hypothetical protein BG844_30625 [Couchioplanes caeruleus subsp. caeruleus]ROP29935.1 hypothetical protein EDD30_2763 [Couchioplanes caeruleus]
MLGRNAGETGERVQEPIEDDVTEEGGAEDTPESPVMPAPPFPTFRSRPTLPHQTPGVGFESGRDSRAR